MRVLVCGDRHWQDSQLLTQWLDQIAPSCVIEGEAKGADSMGRDYALKLGIAVERYPADWKRFGLGAGPKRNQQMLNEGKPQLVLAFHDDIANSKGTKDMIKRAQQASVTVWLISHKGKQVYV